MAKDQRGSETASPHRRFASGDTIGKVTGVCWLRSGAFCSFSCWPALYVSTASVRMRSMVALMAAPMGGMEEHQNR